MCPISETKKATWRRYSYTPKGKYQCQKRRAKKRNIPWEFTFESWWNLWQESGHWEERKFMGYVMARIGDTGSYSPTNVYITTHSQNMKDAWKNGIFDTRVANQRKVG